jgi:CRP-like cAMP-binding protein
VVLHAKHPIFAKLDIDTLKNILSESSIIYLNKDQVLYRNGSQDNFVYFVLFGKLALLLPTSTTPGATPFSLDASIDTPGPSEGGSQITLGRVNIGWTIGEEVLFDKNLQIRQEICAATVDSCLLGILKSKLAII